MEEHVPLASYSTFRIGGKARWLEVVQSAEEMRTCFSFAKEKEIPFLIVGKGSNSLFDDRGFQGLVIINKIDFLEETAPGHYHVGGGYSFSRLGVQTARWGYAGLEFASGIPATVGGAIFMNAGAGGNDTQGPLVSVEFMDVRGEVTTYLKEELEFSYRFSSFHKMQGAIVGATFALAPCSEARVRQLGIIDYRTRTQPYGEYSCGCIFRNPERDSAGSLIERAQLKGMHCGDAEVSEKHANFIVNRGGATSCKVKELIERVRKEVEEKMGVVLEREIRYVPYE